MQRTTTTTKTMTKTTQAFEEKHWQWQWSRLQRQQRWPRLRHWQRRQQWRTDSKQTNFCKKVFFGTKFFCLEANFSGNVDDFPGKSDSSFQVSAKEKIGRKQKSFKNYNLNLSATFNLLLDFWLLRNESFKSKILSHD